MVCSWVLAMFRPRSCLLVFRRYGPCPKDYELILALENLRVSMCVYFACVIYLFFSAILDANIWRHVLVHWLLWPLMLWVLTDLIVVFYITVYIYNFIVPISRRSKIMTQCLLMHLFKIVTVRMTKSCLFLVTSVTVSRPPDTSSTQEEVAPWW